jgi:ClpP class serine protease
VILVDESYAEHYKQIGLQLEIFRAGKFKAANVAGEGYSEDMRGEEQRRIERMHDRFKSVVKRKRSYARDEDMEGQVFTGEEAAEKGLITGLATSFNAALDEFERTT